MAEVRKCPKCGTELPTGVLGGRCPKCLGEVVFGISPGGAEAAPSAPKPEATGSEQDLAEGFGEQTIPMPTPEFGVEHVGAMIGRYKLLEKIGEGGFGVVYMAEQVEPVQRKVALKIIKAGMDTREVIARFEAERQALALMDHPNIAQVLDAGATDTGRPYFVMELVRGIPITDYCDQKTLSTAQRLALFLKVCHAVQHAHQKGIIHRDLKPSNVLVTTQDDEPVPKVIDFGVAKALGHKLTEKTLFTGFTQMVGTPAYMSPEQAELSGLDIDTRADIYSLGVLLYELLTGVTPFDKRTLAKAALDEMRRMIRETEPLKPSTRLGNLGAEELTTTAKRRASDARKLISVLRGDLDWIVMKCLEKDRTRRYATANGLEGDVQRYLNQEPVVARPPSNLYRLQKMIRRNKLAFAAGSAVAAALVLGLCVSTWMFFREKAARKQAVAAEAKAQTAASKSQQVAQFLKDMLKGVGPSKALGRDTTMLREILDTTTKRVGVDLTNQPEVAIELRAILADVHYDLALYPQMEQLVRENLSAASARFGTQSLPVAYANYQLGEAQYGLGRYEQAENFVRAALETQREILGSECLEVSWSLNNLGIYLWEQGKLDQAEEVYREALRIKEVLFGNEHWDVAISLDGLGTVLLLQGKFDEAEPKYRRALSIYRKVLPPKDFHIPGLLMNLGYLLASEDKLAEAEQHHLEALAIQREVLPAEHPDVARTLDNLAFVHQGQGKLAEAEIGHRQALAMRRKLLGNKHPDVALSLNNLALCLCRQGRLAEAETTIRDALAMRRELLGNEHPDVAQSLDFLGIILRARGQLTEAEATNRVALAMRRKLLRNEHPDLAASLDDLACVLRDRGKHAEAAELLQESLRIREKRLPDDWRTFSTRSTLGGCLAAQKKYPEAEPLLLSGYEGMQRRQESIFPLDKPLLKEALERLVQLYEATDRPDQAAAWKKKLAEFENAGREKTSFRPTTVGANNKKPNKQSL